MEEWKDIKGYEGFYQVSSFGNVRSVDRFVNNRFYKGINLSKLSAYGYSSVQLRINVKKGCFYIHRLVASAFIPNPANKPQVNHIDRNKQNNNVSNLEWVTQSENKLHEEMISFHTRCLSDSQIFEIRRMHKEGASSYFLANFFKQNTGTIHNIVNYKTYKNVV